MGPVTGAGHRPVFWALLLAATVALVRYLGRADAGREPVTGTTAEQVLAERFARGEIDEDEFTRRRELLRACT